MGLLSIFRSRVDAGSAGSGGGEPVDAVQRARTRARQRLIGAVVLVVTGVAGFPLVFESQPRPVPVDIPIEIPRKEGVPALVMPPARVPAAPGMTSVAPDPRANVGAATATAPTLLPRASQPVGAAPAPAPVPVSVTTSPAHDRNAIITESGEESSHSGSGAGVPGVAPAASHVAPAAASTPHRLASAPVVPRPSESTATPLSKQKLPAQAALIDGARAKALLEGADAAPPSALRFVVQIGAFADAGMAREARLKVDKLGLKTYTQSAQTPAGPRVRVRVGPFATRDEAVKAQDRARGAGLSAVVLAL